MGCGGGGPAIPKPVSLGPPPPPPPPLRAPPTLRPPAEADSSGIEAPILESISFPARITKVAHSVKPSPKLLVPVSTAVDEPHSSEDDVGDERAGDAEPPALLLEAASASGADDDANPSSNTAERRRRKRPRAIAKFSVEVHKAQTCISSFPSAAAAAAAVSAATGAVATATALCARQALHEETPDVELNVRSAAQPLSISPHTAATRRPAAIDAASAAAGDRSTAWGGGGIEQQRRGASGRNPSPHSNGGGAAASAHEAAAATVAPFGSTTSRSQRRSDGAHKAGAEMGAGAKRAAADDAADDEDDDEGTDDDWALGHGGKSGEGPSLGRTRRREVVADRKSRGEMAGREPELADATDIPLLRLLSLRGNGARDS